MARFDHPIRTERLILRPFTEDDFDDLFAFHSDPGATRYLYWEPRDRDQTRAAMEKKLRGTHMDEDGSSLEFAVEHEGTVIGDISLFCNSKRQRQGEIGFLFHPAHHGRGFATEASRVVLEVGFSVCGFHRIFGRCDARNAGSFGLMERLGMRREAHFIESELVKGEWTSNYVYAILAREWAARAP